MMVKPKILVFNRYYMPAKNAGGPLKSLPALFDVLVNHYSVYLVVLDRDVGSNEFFGLSKETKNWHKVNGVNVRYLMDADVSIMSVNAIIEELSPNLLYTNSFFDHIFSLRLYWLAMRLNIPLLIAPRGELNPGAVSIKFLIKFLYKKVFKLFFSSRFYFHATSIQEVDCVKDQLNSKKTFLAQNLSNIPEISYGSLPGEPIRICFIARISKIKNLDFALNVIRQVKRPVVFDVYGPVEDLTLMTKCREMANELNNALVNFHGAIDANKIGDTLKAYHLYFLPTKGENFGYAIAEALAAGVPVLISDQTPWEPGGNAAGAHYPLKDAELFVEFIENFDSSDSAMFTNRIMARRYYEAFCNRDYWVNKHLEMFSLVSRSFQ